MKVHDGLALGPSDANSMLGFTFGHTGAHVGTSVGGVIFSRDKAPVGKFKS